MDQYRKSPRASFINYDGGNFFITVCTKDRVHHFGEIVKGTMHLTALGLFLQSQLEKVSDFYPEIRIPYFTVMPNHIHLYVCMEGELKSLSLEDPVNRRNVSPAFRNNPQCERYVPLLSRYINSLKGSVTKFAREQGIEFGWQSRYHDHYIRGRLDGQRIIDYILNNVTRWNEDCFNE